MSKKRMPQDVVEKVLARSGGNCEAMIPFSGCNLQGEHLHHRKISGREHTVENLLHLCEPCHRHVHANPAESYGLGFLVKMSYEPDEVPVARRGRVVLLDSEGGYEIKEEE